MSSISRSSSLPAPLPILVPTPRNSEPLEPLGTNDTWLFSPPALRRPSGRTSSIAAFFQMATLPPLHKAYPTPDVKDSNENRRRQYRLPFVLFACFAVFAIVAGVLVFGSGTSDNASDKSAATAPETPAPTPTPTPAPTAVLESIELTEDLNSNGVGNGEDVPWKRARYYFVNNCSMPLHIYQKPVDIKRWAFCDLDVGRYGCASNETGTNYHTPNGGFDQATLFEATVMEAGRVAYDISIIPPGCDHNVGLDNCKKHSGKVGFNLPMRVVPLNTKCDVITCLADGCEEAYLYPADNTKVHTCVDPNATFQVTFCAA
ncbi:hypothetical protein SDRG_15779 [Saprolegnia diclina VS20]|uniref:Uncharacterized protein n=1 Tax=Saprolegnia diclina (strain VS20) TaxID=1156394 RepID=T0R2W5_SAPDV|nr:hypothetical protein SDRG_15779 [Saprolegnia diclina VS20]EQC26368.1 hypothetical protein SDRG_15779 [Saprolegnia diclina VS20]|eukprot:XP_008620183.1 hypothetical protein SDRG_15779 [Saprolegnia diclina VS20]